MTLPITPGPRALLPRTQYPCAACLREMAGLGEDFAAILALEVMDDDLSLCFAHLMGLPAVLAEAMRETAKLPEEARRRAARRIPTAAEIESARQWSAHLGRLVAPGQRVDALAHLIAERSRT